ncbi:DNA methylase [Hyphomonas neptunium ATCC 15444]|uniref:Methyltransferase n=2 Tax=Hyphomonas TaxID=85 RepID=Q0BZ55_HYPNA|nr:MULTISPECIES: DNA methyltransferase [Hyphomonas]ABI76439.1 DNA methylase [Hyphomonas neptunium ATCC 15444]KCZ95330.1 DNA methylase [Hyphomonas hirschiana VP5]
MTHAQNAQPERCDPLNNFPTPTIIHVAIAVLIAYPRSARRHTASKLKKLIKSIQDIGLLDPIIIDESNMILSGHLRVGAFKAIGLDNIPAIRITHLSRDQKAAFVLHANKIVEEGSWDKGILKQELSMLVEFGCDIDLETTGFDIGEIDLVIGSDEAAVDEEPLVPPPPAQAVTRPGDLWIMGQHRLLCGSCLEPLDWQCLMRGERARVCFTDPPYNVKIKGHVSSKDHDEFAMGSSEMSPEQFVAFLYGALGGAVEWSIDGAIHYICMDHRHMRELYAAADPLYSAQLNLCVWAKTNGGMGSFYRSRHELVAVYKVGTAPHINNVQLGRFGRNRTNVWSYAGANTFRKGRDKDIADHPTVKPVTMVADAIMDASAPGDICIDGFGGSGTLILAAERTNRVARVIELEPKYCDVAVRRWEEMTGRQAVLDRTGKNPPALFLPPPGKEGAA